MPDNRTLKNAAPLIPDLPADELGRRAYLNATVASAASHLASVLIDLRILAHSGMVPGDIVDAVAGRLPEWASEMLAPLIKNAVTLWGGVFSEDPQDQFGIGMLDGMREALKEQRTQTPFHALLARLFAESPKLEDASGKQVEGQAPAIPEVTIRTRSGLDQQGTLSTTPEGMCRMLTPTAQGNYLIETFFDPADVELIGFARAVSQSVGSGIIMGRS